MASRLDMPGDDGVLVVNFSAPELDYLAAALSKSGCLKRYVRPYMNKGRTWERGLERIPVADRACGNTLGRRRLPSGLDPSAVLEVAWLADFAAAVAGRLGNLGLPAGGRLSSALHYRMQRELANTGGQCAATASAVVASALVALPAFRSCAGRTILDYPAAHHRYVRKFVADESERRPAFASMLPDWSDVPAWVEPKLDAEVELADRILVGSDFARRTFLAEGVCAEKVRAVPYGVDVSLFSPGVAPRPHGTEFRVLFVGRIGQGKGIGYLLDGYDRFRDGHSTLTLVGNIYRSGEPLRRYAGLFRHVPNVPRTRLAELYREADVFVFPSLIEGFGLVVLEAMASGLPVIVTPNGPGDVVRDEVDGFVVPMRDADAIADRLERLRANPELRSEMGARARKRAMEFTWEAYQARAVAALGVALHRATTGREWS